MSSGLYYVGAGVGAVFIILWVAPAANILALSYAGSLLGGGMVAARVVAVLLMAFVVGGVMNFAFRNEKREEFATGGWGESKKSLTGGNFCCFFGSSIVTFTQLPGPGWGLCL